MIRINPDIVTKHQIEQIVDARNNRPDPELGNLSPHQVHKLIYLPWNDPNYPIKFNKQLSLSDLKDSVFFANATIFLNTLLELKNQDTATAKRNLNRKFVKAVFDKLVLDAETKADILRYNKVINEEDIMPLHVIRIVCEEGKLVQCRKKKFLLTTKGKEVLPEENTGQLFYELFHSYFREFNIAYVDRLPDFESIQRTIGYSFWRLSQIADDFRKIGELFEEILLLPVKKEIRKALPPLIQVEWLVESRIVSPLEKFGLLECRYKDFKGYRELEAVRKTELFDRFMRWEW